jgi:hypothetical protein
MVYMYIFFIHSFNDKCLGYYHFLAIVNGATINMKVQIPLRNTDFISFSYITRSGISGPCGSSIFNIWGTSIVFSISIA